MNTSFGPRILPQDSPVIPLLEKNDTGRGVYISHLDRSPISKKILTFVGLFLINIAFAVIMLWRASKNYNVVLALVLNDFHYVETGVSRTTMKKGFWSWCWMFMVTTFDYCLLGFLWPKVRNFITGHLWFRLRYGFQTTEIVIRALTGKELEKVLASSPMNFQQASQAPNLDSILENAGLNSSRPFWELCYAASMDAYRLADDGVFDSKNWDLSVWHRDGDDQWTVSEIWKYQDPLLCGMVIELMKLKIRLAIISSRNHFPRLQ